MVTKYLSWFGFEIKKIRRSLKEWPSFLSQKKEFFRQGEFSNEKFDEGKLFPCLLDKYESSGMASGHYFHQDLLVAKRLFKRHPDCHIDVGSRIDGFVAHVAVFRQIKVIDIRPLTSPDTSIQFLQADLMKEIPLELRESCDSLSCLHAAEHFGLGRYGDPLDWNGHLTGFNNLTKMLKKGGILYFSVPFGPQRIEFNAHRVFNLHYLLNLFSADYKILDFSFVDDSGNLHCSVELNSEMVINNFGCKYGCAIFELEKL